LMHLKLRTFIVCIAKLRTGDTQYQITCLLSALQLTAYILPV
jgi:hypothetical protein